MIYQLLWYWVNLTNVFFFKKIYWKSEADIRSNGKPKMFAANHPNSFLDALMVACHLPYPVHYLSRGDALQGKLGRWMTKHFHMHPIWREREGRENLNQNYDTFDTCLKIWKQGGALIIFSEGLCKNEWHLRTLPKGTARLAQQAHAAGIDLEIIPTGINYGHFKGSGKSLLIQLGAPLAYKPIFEQNENPAMGQRLFNQALTAALQPLVWEANAKSEIDAKFPDPQISKPLGKLFRKIARILHAPYFFPLRILSVKLTRNTVHFDAVFYVLLMLSYPFFVVLLIGVLHLLDISLFYAFLWPLTAFLARRLA